MRKLVKVENKTARIRANLNLHCAPRFRRVAVACAICVSVVQLGVAVSIDAAVGLAKLASRVLILLVVSGTKVMKDKYPWIVSDIVSGNRVVEDESPWFWHWSCGG
jgi:hypothetical protein